MPDISADERNLDAMRQRDEAVRKQHAASVNSRRRTETAKAIAIVGLGAGCAWLVFSNGQLSAKLAGRDVVYAMVQPNGEIIASTHYSDVLPAAKQQEQVANALWTYAQARDCYGSSSPLRQFYIAQSMSDERVGKQVRDQFAIENPDAPQHIYGEHNVTVQCDVVDPPTPIGDIENNQYLIRFRRWEQGPRATPTDANQAPVYSVTMRFRTGVYPQDDPRRAWLDRTTFNAPGVQIIDYPGAKPENARPIKSIKQAAN